MPLDGDYEFVEVKVSHKIDIKLSLDDLVAMVQAEAAAAQQLPPQIASELTQLTQQLKGHFSGGGGGA